MLRRKSRWRRQNQRRKRQHASPAGRARAAEARCHARAEYATQVSASLEAEIAEAPAPLPTKPSARPLRARFTIEILTPSGERERHQFTSTWSPLFQSWSVPATRITKGIAALLANAPRIVAT